MDFEQICQSRYSVRSFSEHKAETEKIHSILNSIRQAPTALNHQPYKIVVAYTVEAIEKLKRAKATLYEAKTVLIVCSERDNAWSNRYSGENYLLLDIGIVVATALYAAKENGLDSCCVCNFDPVQLKKEFCLGNNLTADALILLGYASNNTTPNERHFIRRTIDEFTIYD